jgi:hypothetical protein
MASIVIGADTLWPLCDFVANEYLTFSATTGTRGGSYSATPSSSR